MSLVYENRLVRIHNEKSSKSFVETRTPLINGADGDGGEDYHVVKKNVLVVVVTSKDDEEEGSSYCDFLKGTEMEYHRND